MSEFKIHPLQAARKKLGMKQHVLADLTGLSTPTIKRAERGEKVSSFTIAQLCDFFSTRWKRPVKPDDLGLIFEDNGNKHTNISKESLTSSLEEEETPLSIDTKQKPLIPTRFLNMEPEQLIYRYADEREKLLELKTDNVEWLIPEVIVFDNTRARLPITAIHVQSDTLHPQYMIPEKIAGKAKDILEEIEHHFYDSTTIRLNAAYFNNDSLTLTISKAHYLQFVATNYAMDALLKDRGWTRTLRDTVHPDTQLCKLEDSLLCNHIGVGALVFTVDNYLVLPIRSRENIATWQQKIGPSIAGATSYDDDMWTFRAGPVASWIREGREELGLENSDFVEGRDIFFGITRDLLRGGKPEMYFATQLHITRAELEQKFKKARDKWENKELRWLEVVNPLTPPTTEQGRTSFLEDFSHLLNLYQDHFSRPAQIAYTFWFKYMMHKEHLTT